MFKQVSIVAIALAALPLSAAEARYSYPVVEAQAQQTQARPRVQNLQQPKQEESLGEGSTAALVGARETATRYRVQSMVGQGLYSQKIICTPSDVNIGTNSTQPTNVGNLVVFTGGRCPYGYDRGE